MVMLAGVFRGVKDVRFLRKGRPVDEPLRGTPGAFPPGPDLPEIRVNVCCQPGRRFDQPMGFEAHQDHIADQAAKGQDISTCWVWLDCDALRGREPVECERGRFPAGALDAIVRTVSERPSHPNGKRIVLDIDGLVPCGLALHIFAGIRQVEGNLIDWSGNPRIQRFIESPRFDNDGPGK